MFRQTRFLRLAILIVVCLVVGCSDGETGTTGAESVGEWPRSELAYGEFEVRLDRAHEQVAEGNWQDAADTIESILTLEPQRPSTYSQLNWELAYNIGYERPDLDNRYDCVRRGQLLMLDGLRNHSNHPYILYHLAESIHRTVGQDDGHEYLQERFAADQSLHARLGEVISLDRARDPDGRVNNFLVARDLYRAVQAAVEQSGFPEDWWEPPEFLIWLKSPTSQYVYLKWFGGHRELDGQYLDAWRELDAMLDEYETSHLEAVEAFMQQHPNKPQLGDPLYLRCTEARNAQWEYEFMRKRSAAEQSDLTIETRRMHMRLLPDVEMFPVDEEPIPEDLDISAQELSELIEAWKSVAEAYPVMAENVEQLVGRLEGAEDRLRERR